MKTIMALLLIGRVAMAKDTKEKILDAALEIFARDGYAGTNIKDIADSVGIVKSALYKHFESKEAIWDAVMDRIAAYYETQVTLLDKRSDIPKTADELIEFTRGMLNFTLHDNRVVCARKVITTEQFRDIKTRDYANKYFLYRNEEMFTSIFKEMMERGVIKKCDPKILALAYTTPIAALIHLCDRDPDREDEAMQKLESFVKMFIDEYAVND